MLQSAKKIKNAASILLILGHRLTTTGTTDATKSDRGQRSSILQAGHRWRNYMGLLVLDVGIDNGNS